MTSVTSGPLTIRIVPLRCVKTEVARARRAIRRILTGCPEALIDTAELCASEIVTNAIVHSDSAKLGGTILLVVVQSSGSVRVEVVDHGSRAKEPRVASGSESDSEDGRGLLILEASCDSWGCYEDEAGRTVWFAIGASR
ncbi:ATP-binding protein [Spirillospora sp. CA-294931]|uniref:ATP-binding protein n=1 Tax=Spirillospora sp. CA-294931 TaxID=3240042 RepID=UPI003D8D343C